MGTKAITKVFKDAVEHMEKRRDLMYCCWTLDCVQSITEWPANNQTPAHDFFHELFKPKSVNKHFAYFGDAHHDENTQARMLALALAYEVARTGGLK